MIIELIGLPGAGKTTFKRQVIVESSYSFLGQEILCLLDYLPVFFARKMQFIFFKKNGHLGFLGSVFVNIFISRLFHKSFINNRSFNMLMAVLINDKKVASLNKILITFASFSLFERASNINEVAIFDEGPAQRGVTFSREGVSSQELEEYYKNSPKPDILIVFDIDEGMATERVVLRDGESSQLLLHQERMLQAVQLCEKEYRSSGVPVIMYQGEAIYKDFFHDLMDVVDMRCGMKRAGHH